MLNPDSEYYLSDEAFARKNHLSMELRSLGRVLQKEGRVKEWMGFSLTEDISLFLQVNEKKVIHIQTNSSNYRGEEFPVRVREMDGLRLWQIRKLPIGKRPAPGHEEEAVKRVILESDSISMDNLLGLLQKEAPLPRLPRMN